jgi:hypothetical protein
MIPSGLIVNNNVIVETLTTGRMIPSGLIVSNNVIVETLTTGRMIPSGYNDIVIDYQT